MAIKKVRLKDTSGDVLHPETVKALITDLTNATTTDDGLMSSPDKIKLNGIAEGAEVNVNPDWNSSSGDAQILNKASMASASVLYDSSNNNFKLPDSWSAYLKKQTFLTPSINTLTLCNASGTAIATTYELGSSATVAKIKHKESNIDNITTNTLKFNSTDILSPVTSDTLVDVTDVTVSSTTTFYLKAKYVDTTETTKEISKSATLTFNRYAYANVTSSTTTPTTGTQKSTVSTFASSGADFTYAVGDYIYLFTTSSGKTIQTYVLGQWADVATDSLGTVSFTQANGSTYNYYAYRTGPFIAAGTAKYRV